MFCHLAALAGLVVPLVGNVLGPYVIWQIKKNDLPEIERHAKDALNFNILIAITGLVIFLISFVGGLIPFLGCIIVPLALLATLGLFIFWLIQVIMACIKINNNEAFSYRFTYEFVK